MDKDLSDIEKELHREALESQVLPPETEIELTTDGHKRRFRITEPYFSIMDAIAHIGKDAGPKGRVTLSSVEEVRDGPRITNKHLKKAILFLEKRHYIKLKRL